MAKKICKTTFQYRQIIHYYLTVLLIHLSQFHLNYLGQFWDTDIINGHDY